MTDDAVRIRIGRVPVDVLTFEGAIARICELVSSGRGGGVFTPNVDHVVMAEDDARFRDAYARVALSLADGMPVLWGARLLGTPLPAKISGSDLLAPLVGRAATLGLRVYLLGGADGVAIAAASKLRARHPGLVIAGTASPRVDMSAPPASRAALVKELKEAAPDLVLVAFGAPKQELFIDEIAHELRPAVLLGIGASLDFVAGTVRRAPAWMSRAGLEWAFRLGQEPRRLWRRYLVQDPRFLAILARQLRSR